MEQKSYVDKRITRLADMWFVLIVVLPCLFHSELHLGHGVCCDTFWRNIGVCKVDWMCGIEREGCMRIRKRVNKDGGMRD